MPMASEPARAFGGLPTAAHTRAQRIPAMSTRATVIENLAGLADADYHILANPWLPGLEKVGEQMPSVDKPC